MPFFVRVAVPEIMIGPTGMGFPYTNKTLRTNGGRLNFPYLEAPEPGSPTRQCDFSSAYFRPEKDRLCDMVSPECHVYTRKKRHQPQRRVIYFIYTKTGLKRKLNIIKMKKNSVNIQGLAGCIFDMDVCDRT
jgi:hypothetical protein